MQEVSYSATMDPLTPMRFEEQVRIAEIKRVPNAERGLNGCTTCKKAISFLAGKFCAFASSAYT
eukprot:1979527-Amphidinium_carterae.1